MNDTQPEEQAPGNGEPVKTVKGPSISDLPPKGIPEIPVREESRIQSLSRRLLTWLIFLLVGVLIGALAVYWVVIRPLNSQLIQARDQVTQSQQQLNQAEQQSTEMQSRVNQLNSLETKNQDLQNQLTRDQILINLLSAQVDLSNARLALSTKDIPTAQTALNQLDGSLKALNGLVPADQQSAVSEMQNRLKLATGELTSNSFAADSDLKVLSKSLSDLATKYPSTP